MLPRQAQGGLGAETQGSAAIHCVRTYHAARRAAFQDYYALKSHYVPTILPRLALPNPPRRAPRRLQARYGFQERRLLRSEFSSRGGAAARVHASSPMSSPMSSPWARRAGDVAPYHGCHGACAWVRAWRVHGAWTWCVLCMLVGADVPGGPRTRCRSRCRPRCRPRGCGAPGTSRPTMAFGMACGYGAWTWCVLCMLVGADVPGGPRPDVVPDVVPVGTARRGRRALPWVPWCVRTWCMRAWRAGMA